MSSASKHLQAEPSATIGQLVDLRPALPAPGTQRRAADTLLAGAIPHRLLRDRQTLLHWIQWVSCIGWVTGLLYVMTSHYLGHQPMAYEFLAVATGMLMLVVYRWVGVFHRFSSKASSVLRLTRAWGLVLAALLVIAFLTQTSAEYSRLLVGTWAALALVGQVALYLMTQYFSGLWQRRLQVNTPALLVGSGHTARHLAESINRNPFLPDFVAGIVDDAGYSRSWDGHAIPLVGELTDLPRLIDEMEVDRIYIALPVERSAEVAQLQRELLERNVDVIWAPDIFALNLLNPGVHEIAGVPLISLSESPLSSGGRAFLKSVMDVFIASAVLLLAAPLMLAVAIAIKATSRGPVFFRQQRHGWDGSVFEVWKFRSMYLHDDEQGRVKQATRDDPRITPIGRLIRRTSIDELPQLFNVLNGTMSLVGPRPHAVAHNLEYSAQITAYMARHRVKPGITGWAQIHGCRGETETVEKMHRRVRLDLEYINNWSLRTDLWILLRTPFSLFTDTAY
ncbi:MAG: undecaprenyl-phosphate glucose phosphotransferase [Gammaproteobacteria bacterium]|nr:undecaprenyl-phosphate glucose phosphotransferase [Gammaproteobacteria bacterium]